MAAITDRLPEIDLEWTSRGKRVTRHFKDAHAAKRFYRQKLQDGREPKVVGRATPADWQADPETEELNATVAAAQQAADTGPTTLAIAQPSGPVGVQPNARTRAYYAGRAIAMAGHSVGVLPQMVAQVDADFQRANPTETDISIRNSWHAIRGFFDALGLPVPPAAQ